MEFTLEKVTIPEDCERIVLCGGPYNNFGAVEKFLAETAREQYRFCLGDMGGFGPYPNRTLDLFRASNVRCLQGNYDYSVAHGEGECGCGYLDPKDRHYAQLSYDYTYANTSTTHKDWLKTLPQQFLLTWRDQKILLCHGSPSQVNEFVWDSETSDTKVQYLLEQNHVNGICGTHTGLPWIRQVALGGFWFNVGVLGRPAHEGKKHVYYGVLEFKREAKHITPKLIPLEYDYLPVVEAMRRENLPEEFCQALATGVWTTCYKILPPEELKVKARMK